jgi:proteasome accessory factor C
MSDAPTTAGGRLHRLLAVLAYLARVGEAPIIELAGRFSLPADTLVAELELAACCGLPPYTPDQLLDLVVDDETVRAYGLEALRRPPRLSAEEGLAVAAAARALLSVPGADAGPLRSALEKLDAALGEDRVRVEVDVPLHLATLQRAAGEHELVEIDYLGAWRGGETTRVVEPHDIAVREGRAYLDAWCQMAGGWRRFAVDRISAVRPLGSSFLRRSMPSELAQPGAFSGGGATRRVRLRLPAEQLGLVERYADGPATREGAHAVVELAVGDERWLGLLLLRLGPRAEIVEPAELRSARAAAARRALRRYAHAD